MTLPLCCLLGGEKTRDQALSRPASHRQERHHSDTAQAKTLVYFSISNSSTIKK